MGYASSENLLGHGVEEEENKEEELGDVCAVGDQVMSGDSPWPFPIEMNGLERGITQLH